MERKQYKRKEQSIKSNLCIAQIYIDPNTLSAEENYRINGVLTTAQIEECLNALEQVEIISDIDNHIQEALAQFPEEDFLVDSISNLEAIAAMLRKGDAKDLLNEEIQALMDLQSSVSHSTELGRDELEKARKEIDAVC